MPGLMNMASTKKANGIQFGIFFRMLEVGHDMVPSFVKEDSKKNRPGDWAYRVGRWMSSGGFLKFPFQLSFLSHIFYNLPYA